MELNALGMIETRGLVAAIEAADAATKAAAVKLIGYQKVRGGLTMIALTGDVAAVQAAVSAGSAAAAKVGQLVSQHVIPRPIEELKLLFTVKSEMPEDDPPNPGQGPDCPGHVYPAAQKNDLEPQEELQVPELSMEYLESLPVVELRRLARKTPGLSIHGRQISKANKERLLTELLRVQRVE